MSDKPILETISTISEILNFITEKTDDRILIFFDMDDVLITGEESLGSDRWFEKSIEHQKDLTTVLEDMGNAYSLMRYHPVEPDTVQVIREVTSKTNVDYAVLTSRGLIYYSQTIKHLKEAGFDYLVRPNTLNIQMADDIVLPNQSNNPAGVCEYPRLRQIRYCDNICFCAGNDKGHVVEELVTRIYSNNQNARQYSRIIVVDDSIKNVRKIYDRFTTPLRVELYKNTSTYTVHYTGSELKKMLYDDVLFKADEVKLSHFKNFISYVNGRKIIDFIVAINVLVGISIAWFIAFRFLRLII